MRWYHRALSGVLAASLSASLLGGIPQVAATDNSNVGLISTGTLEATGEIQATVRMDYPILLDKMKSSEITATLYRGDQEIARGVLTEQQTPLTFTDNSAATGVISWRENEGQVTFLDLQLSGLSAEESQNQYQIKLEGKGFKSYTSQLLVLSNYSQGLIIGTGDATFTQGDLNDDGNVNQNDVEFVKQYLDTNDTRADLNGDGKVDISDFAAITMASGATGDAQVYQTSVIMAKAVDTNAVKEAIEKEASISVVGDLSSLFSDDSQSVTLKPAQDDATQVSIPIPLNVQEGDAGVEMEQIEIVSSVSKPVEKGTVIVETADGEKIPVEFDESAPAGVYAIQTRDDGRKVVTISLGKRVPVKKITINVDVSETDGKEIVVEQIKFVQDIVPENPVIGNNQVQNLKATAGSEQVTLTWNDFPNVTGYKIYYGTSEAQMTSTIETENTTYTVKGLENLKTYYFAVAPVSSAGGQMWEGGKSAIVNATPQPNRVPDKPDRVTVTAGDSLLMVSWKPGKETEYSRVQYREEGSGDFILLDGKYQTSATITGLKNDVTYEVQVFGVNVKGNGPVSETAVGTPKLEQIEGPDLPTVNRLDNSIIVSANYPTGNTDTKVSKGELPGSVYDGDYRTSWVANSYQWSREFTFHFDNTYEMDYLIYVPDLGMDTQKNDGRKYRNFFDSFNIKINGEQVKDVSYEAAKDNEYFIIKFPKAEVQSLSVEGSQWAGAGNITLSEIAFYQYDGLADEISALFANDSHTALAEGIDAEKVAALRERANSADAYYVDRAVLLDELDNAQQLLDSGTEELIIRSEFTARKGSADEKYGQSASALQPLGVSARSNQFVSIYVEGLGAGESLKLVQWQQYSEAGTEKQSYTLHNGRKRVYLNQIGNSGSGERGGALYVEYAGAHADQLKLQVRDASEQNNVVTKLPMLDIQPEQWYGQSESQRKELIRPYVTELQQYVSGLSFVNESSKKTNIRNFTDIATPSVLLSLPADQVLAGLGGAQASEDHMTDTLYDAICAWEQLLFLANKTQGIIAADADFASYEYPMQTRQNIRFSRMFSGAFMFAAGSYIGIDYNETRAMVTGYPLEKKGSGSGIDSDDINGLYGWGIAHEIGHNMDKIGYAEITNNIYSLVAQTADTENMTGTSRLEGMYEAIFNKVALGKPGQAGDVFTQLGMYWQLHLAYDEAGSPLEGEGALDFFNAFFSKWKAGEHQNAPSKDDRIALIASEVTGKDLTEFFTRWGMELSESTKSTLAEYAKETRNIWYLNDQSRRDRLNRESEAELTAELDAVVENEKQVALTITLSDNADRVQGYEILRNGAPVAFVIANGEETQTYLDTVGTANNMAFTYRVRVIDKLGYEVDTATARDVRISYDKVISSSLYDIERDEETGNILITAKEDNVLTTGGLKISGDVIPDTGSFVVLVSGEEPVENEPSILEADLGEVKPTGGWTLAKSGKFSANESQSEDKFLTYFNKPGAEPSDTRIWMYDAKQIAISGIPTNVDLKDIDLLSYPGDNIAFTAGASIGILEKDYKYEVGDGETDVIKAGTIIVTGEYRGDPLYNNVHVRAQVQTMKPGSSEAPTVTEKTLSGEALMFAEIPEDGQVSTISDGFFVFIPKDQDAFKKVNEDHGDNHSAGNQVLIALQAQMWRAEEVGGGSDYMTSDTLFISVPRYDSMPGIILEE